MIWTIHIWRQWSGKQNNNMDCCLVICSICSFMLFFFKGTSNKIVKYNLPRDCLRKFFSPRWCFVFERPANSEKMKRMEELTDADLEPSFVKQSRDFCDHLFKEVKTKTMIGGLKVTGKSEYLNYYIGVRKYSVCLLGIIENIPLQWLFSNCAAATTTTMSTFTSLLLQPLFLLPYTEYIKH